MAEKAFDQAALIQPDGSENRLTYEQFFKLPLTERVSLLCGLKVRFYKAGRPITSAEAMK
jgi:hypothetical protein